MIGILSGEVIIVKISLIQQQLRVYRGQLSLLWSFIQRLLWVSGGFENNK